MMFDGLIMIMIIINIELSFDVQFADHQFSVDHFEAAKFDAHKWCCLS